MGLNFTPGELAEVLDRNKAVTVHPDSIHKLSGNSQKPTLNEARDVVKPVSGTQRHIGHPERDFQDNIIALALRLGWRVHAERPAMTRKGFRTPIQGHSGFPDLCLTNGENLIFWECKNEKQVPTIEQIKWLVSLKELPGVLAEVVYPHDWEHIVAIISEGSEVKIE